jgi:hypothetical protein
LTRISAKARSIRTVWIARYFGSRVVFPLKYPATAALTEKSV